MVPFSNLRPFYVSICTPSSIPWTTVAAGNKTEVQLGLLLHQNSLPFDPHPTAFEHPDAGRPLPGGAYLGMRRLMSALWLLSASAGPLHGYWS
jgi:hypothetical protein